MTGVLLEVTGLVKAFSSPEGDTIRIVDVGSFTMNQGEQVALHGPSGSGKTTFLHLLAGILKADAGTIRLQGQDLVALNEGGRDRVRARSIGYVFQSFNLLQGYTALENVLLGMVFGPGADVTRARALLTRVGLGHRLDYRPSQLSVGQQQRVAVARALANRPSLVLADEPTGNLDQLHAADALAMIRDVCGEERAALLLVSHDPAVLAGFERADDLRVINRAAAAQSGSTAAAVPA